MTQENVDFVVCKVCGFNGFMLNRHLSKHRMTADEYRNKFPDSKVACDMVMKQQGESVSRTCEQKPKIDKVREEHTCQYCSGKFQYLYNFEKHIQKEVSSFIEGKQGIDFVVCGICGMRSENLEPHVRMYHSMKLEEYCEKYGKETVAEIIRERQRESNIGKHSKPISEKRKAKLCNICGLWYQPETAKNHLAECVAANPDKYELNQDYVKCPECGKALSRLGEHLRKEHGWDEDRVQMESNKGLKLIAGHIVENKSIDFEAAQEKREATHLERYGYANPFSNPKVQDKIGETNQRRYGVSYPMQNENVFIRQQESAHNGPSALELFFDEHTCAQCVYTGFGGRYVRTKTGVHKYGRLIKDLNPDFMILPSNVLESALAASKEHRKLSSEKHRSKYVVELLGDYYHSKEVIGVEPEEHVGEIMAAYKSAGIECLVLWENDVMNRWESIRPMVDAWIEKAVRDMNENPIWSRATKNKVDRRKASLVCPFGSGKMFRSQKMLEKWISSPLNYWRAGLVEGKDYVVCRECNTRISKVTEHIRKSHGMTKEEYKLKYPEASMVSEVMVASIVAAHTKKA